MSRHDTAPTPRVVEAHRPGHHCRLFFASSWSNPGAWWRVDLVPGESLECSCPFGRRIAGQPTTTGMKLCRHLRAVAELLLAEKDAASIVEHAELLRKGSGSASASSAAERAEAVAS